MSKKAVVEEKVYLGRFSNHLKIGVVGMPNVGKSTLFNILTQMNIPAENYPFCTIDPNTSRVEVPESRLDYLCDIHKPKNRAPAFLTVTDIAGLVKGAHEGEGLGNAFLSHIRAVDGIFHVLRVFDDKEILHVEGTVEPVRDLTIISEELRLKDIETLNTHIAGLEKLVKRIDKTKKYDLDVCQKALANLETQKIDIRNYNWDAKEVEVLNPLQLLTAKNVVYLINMSERNYLRRGDKWLKPIHEWIKANGGGPIVPFSAAFEAKLAAFTPEERTAYLQSITPAAPPAAAAPGSSDAAAPAPAAAVAPASAIPKIISTGYHSLRLIHYFTAGEDECKCWTIQAGTLAPDAAAVIHNDFRDGFVCAEVMRFDDFKAHGSEAATKAAGLCRQQGRKYVVQDGDIIFFKVNAGAGLKKK